MHEMANGRPHPHLSIHSRSSPSHNSSPVTDQYNFLVTPPPDSSARDPLGLWSDNYSHSSFAISSPDSAYPLDGPSYPMSDTSISGRTRSRPTSAYESSNANFPFPEPQLYRSASHRSSLRPSASRSSLGHRSTRSEVQLPASSVHRGESRPPSFIASDESSPEPLTAVLTDELSTLTFEAEDGLRKFQAGELMENDEEWHRLVPASARDVLDKHEVQRQSVIFEVIRSERDYVRDLQLIKDVFIEPLVSTVPIPPLKLQGFINEVFYNLDEILGHHRKLLDALFERQREQHPLVQSIADIVLDISFALLPPYEQYIKHYPIAEAHHRAELRRNKRYQSFIAQCRQDPKIRKRDLITFLSRPVTRLPRLALLLSTIKKHTANDHPDQETLPIVLGVMHDFIKSTQPGIEAAEAKVKFWALCESLVYQRGEIIDLDLYDETRTLIRLGSLARRYRKENTVGYSWADLNVALLDNYLLLLKPERRSSTETRNVVVSRPIPLEYIQVTSSGLPPEMRKEKSSTAEAQVSRSFLESFSIRSSKERHMYPLTISHACDKDKRSYTLYTSSQEEREDWKKAFQSAKFMREVRQDGNKWFAPHTLSEGFFKAHPSGEYARGYTGLITCAVPFSSSGKSLIAVGCETGVYVTVRGQSTFRKVLLIPHVINIATIPSHNKFLVYCGNGIRSYSLDLLGRVAMQTSPPQPLDASREDVTGSSDYVFFMKVAKFAGKSILLYGTRGMVRVYLNILTPVLPSEIPPQRKKSTNGPLSFKPYVEQPIAVPGDAHDVTALKGKIGICAERGIHIFDLEHLQAVETIIPNLSSSGDQAPMRLLQERITRSKPLGLVRAGVDELLVVYNDVGCYITSTGEPARLCGYLRWETSATSYACRNDNLILFSKNFIEIRAIQTGKLIQVIEGEDIRMVHASEEAVLVAMKQKEDGQHVDGRDMLMELVPTQAIEASPVLQPPELWDEWDM